jgi:hypothetical protein
MEQEFFPPIVVIAEETERQLHNGGVGFDMGEAQLYSITYGMTPDNEVTVLTKLELSFADVYEMLESDNASEVAQQSHYLAVVTTGWAAPLNNEGEVEGKPSEHLERRRVRLTAIASREGMASVIRFQDDDEEIVVDEGSATGSLADAIQSLMR